MDTIKWISTYLFCVFLMIIMATGIGPLMQGVMGESATAEVVIAITIICIVFVVPVYITNWTIKTSRAAQYSIPDKSSKYTKNKSNKKYVGISGSDYDNAKESFKHLSDHKLKDRYRQMCDGNGSVEKLALEEELVDRGVLDYSPMHEKLQSIKDTFT